MKNRLAGFTLVELLIIVAIIAVLLAMAAPPVWKAKKKAQELKEQAEKRSDQVDKEYLNRDKERTLNATDESSRDGGLILEARSISALVRWIYIIWSVLGAFLSY